jgi:hypothetical protein
MLALELGLTVRQLLSQIDSKELSEWAAYYSIEPFGNFRNADLPAGIIASTIANCNRGKNSRSFSPQDFMPIGEHRRPRVMEEDEMKNVMRQMAAQQEKAKK